MAAILTGVGFLNPDRESVSLIQELINQHRVTRVLATLGKVCFNQLNLMRYKCSRWRTWQTKPMRLPPPTDSIQSQLTQTVTSHGMVVSLQQPSSLLMLLIAAAITAAETDGSSDTICSCFNNKMLILFLLTALQREKEVYKIACLKSV